MYFFSNLIKVGLLFKIVFQVNDSFRYAVEVDIVLWRHCWFIYGAKLLVGR
jgi:hypothetical protein